MIYLTDKRAVLAMVGFFAVLFLTFYPQFYTSIDEGNFLRLATLLQQGRFSIADPEYQLGFGFVRNAYYPSFIGEALLLVPFSLFSWEGAFLLGMVLHVIATVIFYKLIVVENGRSIWFVPLFLFFPYFIYYSTTLFSDFATGPIVLAAYYFYTREKKGHTALAGTLFGLAVLMRYTNALVFIPFLLYTLVKDRKRLALLLAGFLPLAVFIGLYNTAVFGGPFNSYYTFSSFSGYGEVRDSLAAFSFFTFLPMIAYRLLIVLPLMLFAPFFYRGKGRVEILGAYILFLLFWGSRLQSGAEFNLGPSTLTRYMLPVMPLILLTYPDFVTATFRKLRAAHLLRPALVAVSAALVIGSVAIFSGQQAYLTIQREAYQDIHQATPEHALIISEMETNRYFMEALGDRRFLDTFRYDDFTPYIDDKTFILHKTFREGAIKGFHLDWSRRTEDVIERLNTTLVFEKEYTGASSFVRMKPFTLQIYKVNPTQ